MFRHASEHVDSYYAHSCKDRLTHHPVLQDDLQCDVLVIGAGPAGLMAALTAARAGADVILCDENPRTGGRLLAEGESVGGQSGHLWAEGVTAELAAMENVRIMTRTTVTGVYDQGTFGALERLSPKARSAARPLECFWRIVAKDAILCAGALERPIAFPNNGVTQFLQ